MLLLACVYAILELRQMTGGGALVDAVGSGDWWPSQCVTLCVTSIRCQRASGGCLADFCLKRSLMSSTKIVQPLSDVVAQFVSEVRRTSSARQRTNIRAPEFLNFKNIKWIWWDSNRGLLRVSPTLRPLYYLLLDVLYMKIVLFKWNFFR